MSTTRRTFLAGSLALLAAPLGAVPSAAAAPRRIGYLAGGSATVTPRTVEAFRQALRDLGLIEGHNIVIEYRFAEGDLARLPALAAELVQMNVEVIVAGPTPAVVAAKKATGTIPIVMWAVGDPLGLGLIASLARPGGNVTGVSFSVGTGTVGKALALLREIVPFAGRIAVLSNPANPSHAAALLDVKDTARLLGVQLQLLEVRRPSELDAAFAAMARQHAAAVLVVTDTIFHHHRARLADLTTKNRLPSMHGIAEYVEAGGLASYGASGEAFLRRAASFVDRILKGAKPADLPVEQPTTFELVINMKTAKTLGLTIPPSLLLRADQVIE